MKSTEVDTSRPVLETHFEHRDLFKISHPGSKCETHPWLFEEWVDNFEWTKQRHWDSARPDDEATDPDEDDSAKTAEPDDERGRFRVSRLPHAVVAAVVVVLVAADVDLCTVGSEGEEASGRWTNAGAAASAWANWEICASDVDD